MNPNNVYSGLSESLKYTEQLLDLIERGKDEMEYCISGDILREYRRSMDEAARITKEIQDTLKGLQSAQRPGCDR